MTDSTNENNTTILLTYSCLAECTNCHYRAIIQIPKGIRVSEYPCPQCGCDDLNNE